MSSTSFHDETHRQRLSSALKAVRRLRGLKAAQVAEAMGMPLRSYEHFEGGAGRFDFAKVRQFAEATNADAFAIQASVQIGSPAFAARTAGNKLMTLLLLTLEEFDAELGDEIAGLDSATLLGEFADASKRLIVEARRRRAMAESLPGMKADGGSQQGAPNKKDPAA